MSFVVPVDRWTLARTALSVSSDRFRSLLTVDSEPEAMATRDWTVSDTAAHVVSIAMLYVTLVEGDEPPLQIPDIRAALSAANVDTVADVNDYVLRHFTERDPARLAELLGEATDAVLAATTRLPPEKTVQWLGDARVPIAGMVAHLVNELLVHGWDIARVLRRPWSMPDDYASLYFDQFFLGMLHHDYGVLLDTSRAMPKRPIAVQFRSAYTPTATVVLGDGRIRLAPPDDPVDVRLRFRPARFNLMLFGRTGPAVAAMRRDVVVGGPRPWRLPAFLRVVHMPNARYAPAAP
ncbi:MULTISPECIES: maleylpyruvate isomerase N-terminal domain-containing protein [unclassified Micromonospora]|uniref:maleylpyruvate isomerase N-terminal domain-containing protein n=1 Tax=unclassified Micromonospora TaxID=2617518 RepID=UPI003A8647E3